MADNFTNHVFKTAVASLCQAIGWNSAQTSTVDVLADLWRRQFLQLAKASTNYATHYGRTEVTFDDTALAFADLHVSVSEIEEYANNFDPVHLPFRIPNIPVPKESNLNFLRPGSEEVLTRPVHVHEYMPTWNPATREEIKKAQEAAKSISDSEGEVSTPKDKREATDKSVKSESSTKPSKSPTKLKLMNGDRDSNVVKGNKAAEDKTISVNGEKGGEPGAGAQGAPESPSSPPLASTTPSKPGKRFESENPALKRVRLMLEEEGYAVRQISSAMMTTSGFLTSSVEGRLPESRKPPSQNLDFFEPAPLERKKKIPTMKRIIEGIKKIDKEKENQNVKGEEVEDVYEDYQDNLFSNPDRIQKFARVSKEKEEEKAKMMKKASKAFKMLERAHKEQQKSGKRKVSKAEKRKRKEREEEEESEVESIEGDFSDMDKTPEEMNVEEEEPPTKKIKKAKIPKLSIEKLKGKKEKRKAKGREEPIYEEVESDLSMPNVLEQTPVKKQRAGKRKLEFSDMPSSLFSTQLVSGDDDYTKVRRRSKRNSIDQSEMDMLVPEISINVSKQSRPPQPPQDLNFPMGRLPTQPGLIPANFNTHSLLQQQNQFSIVPSISITPSTPDISLTPLTPHDLATPSSSLGLSSNIGSSITITRISMADKSTPQPAPQPSTSTLTSPLSISITKESHPKVSPNVSYQQEANTGITITPIKMKQHSIPDFSLTDELSRERQRSGSAQLEDDFRTKEQRRKDREKRKELKKERKKEKKMKDKEKGKVEKIKLSSDGGTGFSVERKDKKDKEKKKSRDSLSGVPGRMEGTIPKLTLKIHSNTSTPVDSPRGMDRETPPPARKFTIKSTEESIRRRTPSPELARFSPLISRQPKLPKIPKVQSTPKPTSLQPNEVVSFPPPGASSGSKKSKKTPRPKGKASQSGLVTETVGIYIDEEGNKIWICPACGRQDDGTPMIGCDTCDDWYHFTCVGITEAPDETVPWYCVKCRAKRARPSDQKRKVLKL